MEVDTSASTFIALAGALSPADLHACIKSSCIENFGDVGAGVMGAGLAVKLWNPVTRLCLVRAPAAFAAEVHASIALVKEIRKIPCALHVLQVCGSVRTLRTLVRHWVLCVTEDLRTSSDMLDAAFFEALDAEIAEAV